VRALWTETAEEVLIEGPAGTGKTRGLLERCYWILERKRYVRMLWLRQTRKSMNESVLETWEEEVLPPGHPMLRGPTRGHRDYYWNPSTKSRVVLGGMDHPDRFMSSQYDLVIVFEAIETTLEAVEKVTTRLRNGRLYFVLPGPDGKPHKKLVQQLVLDTNPGRTSHWINKRADKGMLLRYCSRHVDNPRIWDAKANKPTEYGTKYLGRLDRLTGTRRAHYRDGKWCSAEGQVIPGYDPHVHRVFQPPIRRDLTDAQRASMPDWAQVDWRKLDIVEWFGSFDWGDAAPCCFQLWGVTKGSNTERAAYRVCEIYKRGTAAGGMDYFAACIEALDEHLPISRIWMDPSEDERIQKLNDRLGAKLGRKGPQIVVDANNARSTGIDMVRWAIGNEEIEVEGVTIRTPARMFFVHDAHWFGMDQQLLDDELPACTETELEELVWRLREEGKRHPEEFDPNCEDHGFDGSRYLAMGIWDESVVDRPKAKPFPKGSIGYNLGHEFDDEPLQLGPGLRNLN
jgi:hypothetical protein